MKILLPQHLQTLWSAERGDAYVDKTTGEGYIPTTQQGADAVVITPYGPRYLKLGGHDGRPMGI